MKIARPSLGSVVLALALLGLLAASIWGAVRAWRLAGDAPMSVHGYLAMAIAAVGTLVLGGGLMWLAFYSSRAGYDDDQQDPHG